MARALDPTIARVLKEYDEDAKSATWDCHGVTVVLHKAIERMAARARIIFDQPTVIEASAANKVAVICVTGTMGERTEWSFGEACPANNKNAYPFAMAEKRAKDRVVLKLLGLHGLAYSEDESDDFKTEPNRTPGGETLTGRETGAAKQGPAPVSSSHIHATSAETYVTAALPFIHACNSADDVNEWWTNEKAARVKYGIAKNTEAYATLWAACNERVLELEQKEAA